MTAQAPRVLLVDALNLIRRLHAAMVSTKHPNADADALALRVQNALRKSLNQHQPSHAILVWDGGHEHSWRREFYPDYKAHRKPMPEDLAGQLPALEQAAREMGIHSVRQADLEADDLIATLASKVAEHGGQALILSTDKGFGQLLSPAIHQWDHFEGLPMDADFMAQKVGVPQPRLLDYWALAGDSGNGIPGVPGVGKKTAVDLIQRFASLAAIFQPDAVDGKLGEKLQANQQQARLSYRLVRLRRDLKLDINLSQFRIKQPIRTSS